MLLRTNARGSAMKRNEDWIAIYSRKSRFTGKGESIGNQIELCKDYVRNMFGEGYAERCVVFEDEGFSGGDLKRPDFQRMMEGVRKHRFRAIVVYRLDRISRNISDFTNLIDELTKLDVSFVSIREQFDTSTPMGRAMMFIISVFSQLERETIAERIRDNMHELAKTGRWLGGNTPTGFGSESVSSVTMDGKTRKACKLKLIPEEGELVRTIFDLYTETDSLTATEAELLRRRTRSRQGNDFTRFSIKGILQNPVYMTADGDAYRYLTEKGVLLCSDPDAFDGEHGLMVYNRTDQEKGKAITYLPMTEWIVAVGRHPGLIPARQWIAVQQSLDRNKSKSYRKPRNNEALLTGVLFCACGERMYPKGSGRRTADRAAGFTYVCKMKERSKRQCCSRPNANGNVLDTAILERIKMLPEDGEAFLDRLEKSRRIYTDSREQYETQLADLKGEQAENERKIEGLIDSMTVLEGSAAKRRVAQRVDELTETNREIEERIRELEGLTAENVLNAVEFDLLRQKLTTFSESIDGMSVEEKRSAVRSVVRRVIWDGSNAHVVLLGSEGPEEYGPGPASDVDRGAFPNAANSHWGECSKTNLNNANVGFP